jgi:hypothetical protein
MRKSHRPRKLALSAERLRVLTGLVDRELKVAAGGATFTCTEPTHSIRMLLCQTGPNCA